VIRKGAGPAPATTDSEARKIVDVGKRDERSSKTSQQHLQAAPRRDSGGACHRQKGSRVEREIVERHRAIGIHAERYPLSGASRFRGAGHDVDLYLFGRDEAPAVAEVKARKSGAGFTTLERWLGTYDALFLRRNNADPVVVLPWQTWARLLTKVRP
jgi:hypothetical protein